MLKYSVTVLVSSIVITLYASSFNLTAEQNNVKDPSNYMPFKNTLFIYLMSFVRNSSMNATAQRQLEFECADYRHGFSYYFLLIYDILCWKNDADAAFCNSGADDRLCMLAKRLAEKNGEFLSKLEFRNQSVYKELIFEDVSFCTPVVCPYVNKKSYIEDFSLPFPLYMCMPTLCKVGFYAIFSMDIILSITISFINVFVLIIGMKHSFLKSPGG